MKNMLLLLLLSVFLTRVSCFCENSWMRFDDSCYLFEDLNMKTWHEALESCFGYGGNLVKIETQYENSFIVEHLKSLQPHREDQFWTAGNDIQVEGQWSWAHSQEKVTLDFWYPGEPNHLGNEDCLAFYTRYNFNWNDEHCDNKMAYICEVSDPIQSAIVG